MPRRAAVKKQVDLSVIHKIVVSGRTYEAGLKDYKIQPTSKIARGLGFQYRYQVNTLELRELADHLADVACGPEDKPTPQTTADAIYRDLDRFPKESNLR